jgi:hypothetical protein
VPMTNIADAIGDLDRRIADVESNMATLRREMAAPGIPAHMLGWLLDFLATAEAKLGELRDRRAEMQRSRETDCSVHETAHRR